MNRKKRVFEYDNLHVAWLSCLFAVVSKVRKEGLMSIENDVEEPSHEDSVFARFPQVNRQPYLEFATDVLRMMVAGNLCAAEMQVYAECAIEGLRQAGAEHFRERVDESLLKTIWMTLWASMNGYAPQTAIEIGRQAVPVKYKPSFVELERVSKEVRCSYQKDVQSEGKKESGLDGAVERFIASLG